MTFDDLKFESHGFLTSTEHVIVSFPNGYGASVVRGPFTYGGKDGLYELAVLKDGSICYDTHITADVIGYLTPENVTELLQQIKAL